MYLTMLSHGRSFRLCGRVLLFGRWPKLLLCHIRSIFVRLLFCVCFVQGAERLSNGQVLAQVDRYGLLSEFQSGFATSEVQDAKECPIKVCKALLLPQFFLTVILFPLVCLVWMVGACS
jgi:hypothetical protein